MVLGVKEPQPARGRDAAAGAHPVHLPAPRSGAGADQGTAGERRDLRRLRDRRGRPRPPAAARADERGRRARSPPRRAPSSSRSRSAAAASCSAGSRAWPPANVMVIGGGAVGMNAAFIAIGMEADVFVYDVSHRQAPRARRRLRRPRLDRLLLDPGDRGDAPPGRPGDRRGAGPRRQGAVRRAPRAAQADEAQCCAGGRRDRPGRLLRDLPPHHAPRSGLRGRRDHPLLRREHARRGADHLDLRTYQRHAAVCAGAGRSRRGRGRAARSRAELGINVAGGTVTHPAVAEAVGVEHTPVEDVLDSKQKV